jgi:hypothetical protein
MTGISDVVRNARRLYWNSRPGIQRLGMLLPPALARALLRLLPPTTHPDDDELGEQLVPRPGVIEFRTQREPGLRARPLKKPSTCLEWALLLPIRSTMDAEDACWTRLERS